MASPPRQCYPVRTVRLHFLSALFLASVLQAFSQAAPTPPPDLRKDPRAVLEMAATLYDFNDPTLKPWHLKSTYQLYDENGKPSEKGTYEFWSASPKVQRSNRTRTGTTRTDWATSDGTIQRIESGGPLRYFERTFDAVLLHPLPSQSDLDSGRMKLDLKMVGEGQSTLACVIYVLKWGRKRDHTAPLSEQPQYYCFEPATMALRVKYWTSITTEYNQIVKTQGRFLSRQVDVLVGKQKALSISIETIDGKDTSALALIPPADSTVDAVKRWQYIPYLLNGQPVEVETIINVVFRMGD